MKASLLLHLLLQGSVFSFNHALFTINVYVPVMCILKFGNTIFHTQESLYIMTKLFKTDKFIPHSERTFNQFLFLFQTKPFAKALAYRECKI